MFFKTILLFALHLGTALAYPNPGPVSGATSGVHDPSLVKRPDGLYILVSTGYGLPIRTSTDRTKWVTAGSVFPNGAPEATKVYTTKELWAPDISYQGGTYYLYYAASVFGSQNSGIFLATSSTGLSGSWVDQGLVISTKTGDSWNAIDPTLTVAGGNKWTLTAGIRSISLDSSTHKPNGSPIRIASRGGAGIEASSLFWRAPYWYLFTSWDKCCSGTSSTYNIRVTRSSSVTGPFVDQAGVAATNGGGTLILATHGNIYGPGGQSVIGDADAPVLVYHYYSSTTSYLAINLLDFSSGWPVVY